MSDNDSVAGQTEVKPEAEATEQTDNPREPFNDGYVQIHPGSNYLDEIDGDKLVDPDEIIHVMRMVEYIGPRKWVKDTLQRSLHNANMMGPNRWIRSSIIGEVSDALSNFMRKIGTSIPDKTSKVTPAKPKPMYAMALPARQGLGGVWKYTLLTDPTSDPAPLVAERPAYPNCVIVDVSVTPHEVKWVWHDGLGDWRLLNPVN